MTNPIFISVSVTNIGYAIAKITKYINKKNKELASKEGGDN